MDTLPRISLVGLPLKKPNGLPDLSPMKKDIERQYNAPPDLYQKDLNSFLSARKVATEPTIDYAGLSKIKRYYAQLQLLKGRFRLSVDEGTAVYWGWCDAFTNSAMEAPDIRLEEGSTLYNIGALHSILGVREKRFDADSMKVACTHFQCAAWALDAITERHFSVDLSPDLTSDLIRALSMIMMGQAQECIVEKSVLDDRPANITAKLTQYLAQTYEQASTQLSLPTVTTNLPAKYQKDWRRRCQSKSAYYSAMSAYYSGQNEETIKAYGRAIAWYQVAVERVGEAEKLVKDMKDSMELPFPVSPGGPLRNNIQHIKSVFQTKLTGLVKDNDFIYHETVPSADSLEQVKPACLVKGVPFDHNDPEVRGPDIFQSLVPMKTLEATSIYSERKASLLRSITAEVDAKDVALEEFMTSIDVDPDSMLAPDPPLPQELYDVCARISALERGPERKLSEMMQSLATASVDLDSELSGAQTSLDEIRVRLDALLAVKQTEELKALSVRLRTISDRLLGMAERLNQAKQSNLQQREVLGVHLSTMKKLSQPIEEIAASLPSVQTQIADPALAQSLNEAQRLFGKVGEMRRQRAEFVDKLRQTLHNDDATGDLLTSGMDQETMDKLFENRLKKHDSLIGLIRQNLAAQENIESALIDVNASFAPRAMELKELRRKRAEELQQLISSGQTFDTLLANCSQGLVFYEQVSARVKESLAELNDIGDKLTKQEQQLTTFTSAPTPSGTVAPNQPYTSPTFISTGSLRPTPVGHIPTLGDYMASMRARPMDPRFYRPPPVSTWSPTTESNAPPRPQVSQPSLPQATPYPSSGLPASGVVYPAAYPTHPFSATTQPQAFPPYRPPQFAPSGLPGPMGAPSTAAAPRPSVDPNTPRATAYSMQQPAGQQPPLAYTTRHEARFGQAQSTGPVHQPNVPPPGSVPTTTQQRPPQHNMPGYEGPRFPASQPTQTPSAFQYPPQPGAPPTQFYPNVVRPDHSAVQPPSTFSGFTPVLGNAPPQGYPGSFYQPPYSASHQHTQPIYSQDMNRMRHPQQPIPSTQTPPQRPPTPGPIPVSQPYGRPPFQPYQQAPFRPPGPLPGSQPQNAYSSPPSQAQPFQMPPQSSTPPSALPPGPIPPHNRYAAPQIPVTNTAGALTAQQQHQQQQLPQQQHPVISSNNNYPTSHTVETFEPAHKVPSPQHQSAPLQPRVLTKEDIDAQRREERLRATYSSQLSLNSDTGESANNEPAHRKLGTPASPSSSTATPGSKPETEDSSASLNKQGDRQPHSIAEPLSDPLVFNRFIASTENLLTWLDNLNEPARESTSGGSKTAATKLDEAWTKVLAMATDYASSPLFKGKKPTQAAALCCPIKNRRQEYTPFDANRVLLDSSKNDYINASRIDFIGSLGEWCPRYIIAQAPMVKTVSDFWSMIMSQGCEVMVLLYPPKVSRPDSPFCSLSSSTAQGEGAFGDPTDPLHIPAHLPLNKVGSTFQVPGTGIELRLQAIKDSSRDSCKSNGVTSTGVTKQGSWTERVLTIQNRETHQTRSLVHLFYTGSICQSTLANQDGAVDASVEQFCAFVNHVHSYYKQQRNLLRPIAVVCEYGAGLSGIFVTTSVGLLHAEMLGRVADVCDIAGQLCQQRRGALNSPLQFVTAARVIAHAAVETVARRDVVVGPRRRPTPSTTPNANVTSMRKVDQRTSGNPLDTLFSDQPLEVDELMSVVDKWSIGKDVVVPLSEHPAPDAQPSPSVLKDMGYARQTVDQMLDDSGIAPEKNTVDSTTAPVSHSSTTELLDLKTSTNKPLVDLDALISPTPRTKRYTRHNFQNPSSVQAESNGDSVFASLDPIQQAKVTTNSNDSI